VNGRPRFALALIAGALALTADIPDAHPLMPALDPRGLVATVADLLPPSDRESEGLRLYQIHCASCHGGPFGGNASDYPPRHNAVGHTWQHADCDLVAIIRDGPRAIRAGIAPSQQMPAFRERLSTEGIHDVLAYIKTMWTDQQRAAQMANTSSSCR